MENNVEEKLAEAIKVLSDKSIGDVSAIEAQQFTQAASNLANTLCAFVSSKKI